MSFWQYGEILMLLGIRYKKCMQCIEKKAIPKYCQAIVLRWMAILKGIFGLFFWIDGDYAPNRLSPSIIKKSMKGSKLVQESVSFNIASCQQGC